MKIEFYRNGDVHSEIKSLCERKAITSTKKYFTIQNKKAIVFVVADRGMTLNNVHRLHKHWAKNKEIARKIFLELPEFEIEFDTFDYERNRTISSYKNDEYTIERDWFTLEFSIFAQVESDYEDDIGQGNWLNPEIEITNLKIILETGELELDDFDYKKIIEQLKNNAQ